MKILRASDHHTTLWKNGGGSTTEIAVEPPHASLDDFDWRVSMAQVATDGPFSTFPDVDRTLAVITGRGLRLTVNSNPPVLLDQTSDPFCFAGDAPTEAHLTGGAITDLNVMTRRGRFAHDLRRLDMPTFFSPPEHGTAMVIAVSGDVAVATASGGLNLAHGDAAIMTFDEDALAEIVPNGSATCYLVLLRNCRDHAG